MRQEQINLDDIKVKLSGKVKFIPLYGMGGDGKNLHFWMEDGKRKK